MRPRPLPFRLLLAGSLAALLLVSEAGAQAEDLSAQVAGKWTMRVSVQCSAI